jgi:hypothetical protein
MMCGRPLAWRRRLDSAAVSAGTQWYLADWVSGYLQWSEAACLRTLAPGRLPAYNRPRLATCLQSPKPCYLPAIAQALLPGREAGRPLEHELGTRTDRTCAGCPP